MSRQRYRKRGIIIFVVIALLSTIDARLQHPLQAESAVEIPEKGVDYMLPSRSELIDYVIPFIDKKFRTLADREHRSMCGLSMGGGQSFYIGLRSLDTFSAVGIFSTGMFGGINGAASMDIDKEVPGLLSNAKEFNDKLKVLLITCGEQDMRIEHNKRVVKQMKDNGLEVVFESFAGDHEWQPWRKSLWRFMQLL